MRNCKAVSAGLQQLVINGQRYPVSFQLGCYTEHLVVRAPDKSEIAHFSWHQHSGEIWDIWVHQDYRRRGIATTLLHMARGIEPAIHHSGDRTRRGDAWAASLGEPLPPRTNWRGHEEKDLRPQIQG